MSHETAGAKESNQWFCWQVIYSHDDIVDRG